MYSFRCVFFYKLDFEKSDLKYGNDIHTFIFVKISKNILRVILNCLVIINPKGVYGWRS